MHETFEHTADIGIRVRAADLNHIFAEAGAGLMDLLVDDPEEIAPIETEKICLQAGRLDDLLFDWLSELLYLFSTRRIVAREFDMQLHDLSLDAIVRFGRFDPETHRGGIEVKAITYHGLRIEESGDGFTAEVIVDI